MPGYNKRKEHYQDYQVNIGNVAEIESSKKPPKSREEIIIEELEIKRKMLSSIDEDLEQYRKTTDNKASKTVEDKSPIKGNAIVFTFIIVVLVGLSIIIGPFLTKKTVELLNRIYNTSAPIEKTYINQPETIYFQSFKAIVQGKTEKQIRDMFGNPDHAQVLEGVKFWYYYRGSKKVHIINEDSEKEVRMVQIEFLYGSAYSINAW